VLGTGNARPLILMAGGGLLALALGYTPLTFIGWVLLGGAGWIFLQRELAQVVLLAVREALAADRQAQHEAAEDRRAPISRKNDARKLAQRYAELVRCRRDYDDNRQKYSWPEPPRWMNPEPYGKALHGLLQNDRSIAWKLHDDPNVGPFIHDHPDIAGLLHDQNGRCGPCRVRNIPDWPDDQITPPILDDQEDR